ncbi:MAG TPA: hypothetical protein PLS49_09620, partial [Candidatus Woesebacteria bacterium]|nr:hypothetical protein [Candidatus Woesebacteria bacterium]
MKKTSLIIIIILILVAAIGSYFFIQNRSGNSMTDSEHIISDGEGSKIMSLKDLMNLGQTQMCTFSTTNESGTVYGTSYTADGNVRTDFNGTDQDGTTYSGGMIMDSAYAYSWTSQMDQGVKIPISAMDTTMPEDQTENPNESYQKPAIDPDQQAEYSCSNWNVDNSVFTPPSNISFVDMSE